MVLASSVYSATSISIVFLDATPLDSNMDSTNIGFNSGNLSAIETVKLRWNVTAVASNISGFYLNFTAGGTKSCSLGNLQSTTCYNITNPSTTRWIEFKNGTTTATYNGGAGNQGDRIILNVTPYSDSNYLIEYLVDEHYNPNVFKWYDALYNFSDIKWQTGLDQRITKNNVIRANLAGIVPPDADQYKLDFRVDAINSPTQPLNAYGCNSSYVIGNPSTSENCILIASKTPAELQDDGTKFRGIFTKKLVDDLGTGKYIILETPEQNPTRYYAIKTYKATAPAYTTKWEYSNDLGTTWANLGDSYETEMNINWFYNGAEPSPTKFIYNLWANNTAGDITNQTNITTWNINANQSYNPLVEILTPSDGEDLGSTVVNISWFAVDPNDDELNITVWLDDVVQVTGINQSNASYWEVSGVAQGSHNVTVKAEKLNNSMFYDEDSHQFSITISPFNYSVKDYGIEWIILNWTSGTNEVVDISTDNLTWTSLVPSGNTATATELQADTTYYFRAKDEMSSFGYLNQRTKSGGINEMEIALSLFAIVFMYIGYKLFFNDSKEED